MGTRSLGMGGTVVAVTNDETALLANPAGLGRLRDSYGTVIDPELDTGTNLANMYLSKAFSNPFNLTQVKDTLDVSREKHFHANFQLFPSYVAKNFGVGLFKRYGLSARTNADGSLMDTYYVDDLALIMGMNFRLFDGRLKLGFNGKFISRIEINEELDTTGSMTVSDHAQEGAAIGADAGLILALPWKTLPTLAAVVRDVGGTNFTAGSGLRMSTAERPQRLAQDIDVGFSISPIYSNRSRGVFALEMKKIQAAQAAQDKYRYYHLGYEYNYSDIFFVRAGFNGRYWTGGFELASEKTQIQISTYGEEIAVDGERKEDRRLSMKFSVRF